MLISIVVKMLLWEENFHQEKKTALVCFSGDNNNTLKQKNKERKKDGFRCMHFYTKKTKILKETKQNWLYFCVPIPKKHYLYQTSIFLSPLGFKDLSLPSL